MLVLWIWCIVSSLLFKVVSVTSMCLLLCSFVFISLGVCKSCQTWGLISLNGFGKIFASISPNIAPFSLSFWDSSHAYNNYFHCLSYVIYGLLFVFLTFFFSGFQVGYFSTDYLIVFFQFLKKIFNLMLNLWVFNFKYYIFQLYSFHLPFILWIPRICRNSLTCHLFCWAYYLRLF